MGDLAKSELQIPAARRAIRAESSCSKALFVEITAEKLKQSIPDCIEEHVQKNPDRIAFKTKKETLTWDALDRSANRVAQLILGVCETRDKPIPLLLDHGLSLIASLDALKTPTVAELATVTAENQAKKLRRKIESLLTELESLTDEEAQWLLLKESRTEQKSLRRTTPPDISSIYPSEQQAIWAKRFHPAVAFVEFSKEEIEESIPEGSEGQPRTILTGALSRRKIARL